MLLLLLLLTPSIPIILDNNNNTTNTKNIISSFIPFPNILLIVIDKIKSKCYYIYNCDASQL